MRVFRHWTLASSVALAAILSACGGGGGGGGGLNSTPTPPPPPPPPVTAAQDPIIPAATTSQDFAVFGAEFEGPQLATDSSGGLSVRYNSVTGRYEVSVCCSQTYVELARSPNHTPPPGSSHTIFDAGPHNGYGITHLQVRAAPSFAADRNYTYSNLAIWTNDSAGFYGATAFGIPTPLAAVPTTGTASYSGFLEGWSDETYFDGLAGAEVPGGLTGNINLVFDFGAGSLSGSLSAVLSLATNYNLGTFSFTQTVFATADRRQFLGELGVPGSSFGGQFTGPAAQEIIGQFVLPYTSPVSGGAQTGAGAFIAKRP